MKRVLPCGIGPLVFGLGVLLLGPVVQAADTPLKGVWRLTAIDDCHVDITLALLRIEGEEASPTVTVVEAGVEQLRNATFKETRADAGSLRFVVTAGGDNFPVAAAPSRSDPGHLWLGSVRIGRKFQPILLERTTDRAIDHNANCQAAPDSEALLKELLLSDPNKQDQLLKDLAEKHPDRPILFQAATMVVFARRNRCGEALRQQAVEGFIKAYALYGPELELSATLSAAREFGLSAESVALSLRYARRAEKLLPAGADHSRQVEVLSALATALDRNGQADEKVKARLARVEEALDDEFHNDAVPFIPETYAGRKGKDRRIVVVELFTNVDAPPCVATDLVGDALLQRYRPTEVVLLLYHNEQSDPLTCADAQKRAEVYNVDRWPLVFLNGKRKLGEGGTRRHTAARYQTLLEPIDEALETTAPVSLSVKAERLAGKVDVTAEGKWLDGKPGDKVRLRLVLIEETARYAGRNGQRLHHHVVRGFLGGANGFAFQDGMVRQTVRLDVAELRRQQDEFLTCAAKTAPFLYDIRPLELKHLKIVALVQDDDTREIRQAAQSDLPEAQ